MGIISIVGSGFKGGVDVLYRYIKVKGRLIADDIILCDMEQVRKMLDEVNDGAMAHHHTLGHAGGAGGEDSVQGVRISGLPADGRKETAVQASSGRDFKSSRNSISPEKEIPTARSRLSLSAIIRSALRVSRIRFRRSAGWFASRQT